MTKFKVGARVRVKKNADVRMAGAEGVLAEPGSASCYPFEFVPDDGQLGHAIGVDEIEPLEPRKDTPRVGSSSAGVSEGTAFAFPSVGDTVRVVLEEKVVGVHDDGFSTEQGGFIYPPGRYVKSVEIITPAKPSVADLPRRAVVLANGRVYRKVGNNTWFGIGAQPVLLNSDIDALGWVQLVEKTDE